MKRKKSALFKSSKMGTRPNRRRTILLPIPDAVHYLRQLMRGRSREQCKDYWRARFGDAYVAQVERALKR